MCPKTTRPVGNSTIGSEGTFCDLGGEHACRPTRTVPLRDGSFFHRIPGNKLPGYHHSVPSGQKSSQKHLSAFSTPHQKANIEDSLSAVAVAPRRHPLKVGLASEARSTITDRQRRRDDDEYENEATHELSPGRIFRTFACYSTGTPTLRGSQARSLRDKSLS
jgi:hypothetical protein